MTLARLCRTMSCSIAYITYLVNGNGLTGIIDVRIIDMPQNKRNKQRLEYLVGVRRVNCSGRL